jgi:hypothetical protein
MTKEIKQEEISLDTKDTIHFIPSIEGIDPNWRVINLSIHATINKVMTDLAKLGIAKNRKNVMQNYQYRGIDDLYDTVASLYAKHGLIIYPQVLEYKHESRPTKTGAANYVMQQVKFIFCHIHNNQTFETIVWGEALDNSDKATNKSLTSAYKYMAIMTLCIPINGVDNDPDNDTPELLPENKTQVSNLDIAQQLLGLLETKKDVLKPEWVDRAKEVIKQQNIKGIADAIEFLKGK